MIRFLYTFVNDDATITSSSQSGNLLDDNVVTNFVQEKWRTTALGTQWIKFHLGAVANVNCIGIYGHNLTSGAALTLQANTSDAWSPPDFTESLAWYDKANRITKCFTLQTIYNWWRLVLTNPTNPDGYMEIGRIVFGAYVEPGVNYKEDYHRILHDPSERFETPGGQNYHRERSQYWEYRLAFEYLGGADQTGFQTMFENVGTHDPLVVMLDHSNYPSARSIFGELTESLDFAGGLVDKASIGLVIEEKR